MSDAIIYIRGSDSKLRGDLISAESRTNRWVNRTGASTQRALGGLVTSLVLGSISAWLSDNPNVVAAIKPYVQPAEVYWKRKGKMLASGALFGYPGRFSGK
jgi:hypothetical protein